MKGLNADHPWITVGVGLLAFGLATISAQPFAGSWNDGSRLAAVESLIQRGTLQIDDSPFCQPPAELSLSPYPPHRADLQTGGTRDKLFIDGHFYSDKPALISVLLAGGYRLGMLFGLPSPAESPRVFCWTIALFTSGLAYAVAVACLWHLGVAIGLEVRWRAVWVCSFALATYLPTYAQYTNNHIMLLAVVAGLALLGRGEATWGRLWVSGMLAGLGYNLDLGCGPPLALATAGLWAWRLAPAYRLNGLAVWLVGAAPWLIACHALNYAVGGVLVPANMIPEYLNWPGSPFDQSNLTGLIRHDPIRQVIYAVGLLLGSRGLFIHNLPTLLLLPIGWRHLLRAEAGLWVWLSWSAMAFAMYAVFSNNHGGACCSVRWFVPFLLPLWWLLGLILRDEPRFRGDFLLLSVGGLVLATSMVSVGPWTLRLVPGLWPIVGMTLAGWALLAWQRGRRRLAKNSPPEQVTWPAAA